MKTLFSTISLFSLHSIENELLSLVLEINNKVVFKLSMSEVFSNLNLIYGAFK